MDPGSIALAVGSAAAAASSAAATATPVLGALGAITTAGGALMSADATAKNAKYQSAVARNNAIVNSYGANQSANAARNEAQTASMQNAARLAGIKTSIAASGLDVNSGSAEDVQQSQREVGELSTENVYQKGLMQNYGYQIASQNDTAQSKLYDQEAAQAPVAGILNATGSLLGNAKAFYNPSGDKKSNTILG